MWMPFSGQCRCDLPRSLPVPSDLSPCVKALVTLIILTDSVANLHVAMACMVHLTLEMQGTNVLLSVAPTIYKHLSHHIIE